MSDIVTVALITAGTTLIGSFITGLTVSNKTIYRIDQLEKKVDKHNNVIERVFKLEQKVEDLKGSKV